MLEVGTKAPDFELPDQNGELHKLSEYLGKKVILYFYPRDNTPGCTRQACAFRDSFAQFRAMDVAVIGISKDTEASHQRFIRKFELPFLLLADPDLTAIKAYEVWQEKKMYGKTAFGTARTTFVIDEQGKILKIFEKAKPDTNASEILEYFKTV